MTVVLPRMLSCVPDSIEEIQLGSADTEVHPDERPTGPPIDLRTERAPPPEMRPTGGGLAASNTGPKGVKADFEEAKRNDQSIKMRAEVAKERVATGAGAVKQFKVDDPLDKEREKLKEKKKKVLDAVVVFVFTCLCAGLRFG